ncbi:outer dense fiber protein 3-like protein 2 [Uranotaenia lowii]|uniref:outer dense fiber protein 3-like protein 2 n=1 Tax=Uranotaenia lowii TaxID=190385 RepID=UPI00247889BD|nr:outer dense fiber protein 3-like protein 2 [Uranotaenia lowii]
MYQMSRIGPGPAGYKLPPTIGFDQHDVRKTRKPMYSMVRRPDTRYDTLGPGPARYDPGKMTRDGAPRTPKYSLAARYDTFSPDKTPGPGAHQNDKVPSMKGNKAPSYSFGVRLDKTINDNVPGPKYTYDLNVYKTRNPVYSMRTQTTQPYAREGPGPAGYPAGNRNITHRRMPQYSMRPFYSIARDRDAKPGADRYNLMELKPGASAPQYSFGTKHSMWRPPMIIHGDNC